MNFKIEIWPLFCMDLQKKQDSNAHGSDWMLVICKHLNLNWHWDWKNYIFLTASGDIVWVTASTKLHELLINWSCDKCKTLYLPFCNTYGHQNWQSSSLPSVDSRSFWSIDQMRNAKHYICTPTLSMATKGGIVVDDDKWAGHCYITVT